MENEVVAPDTPVETVVTETPAETPSEPLSRADTIREALAKTPTNRGKHAATQPRESGKFAPKFPTPPSSEPIEPKAEAAQAPDMPKSLKLEMKTYWEKAPAELRQAIAQREADRVASEARKAEEDAVAQAAADAKASAQAKLTALGLTADEIAALSK